MSGEGGNVRVLFFSVLRDVVGTDELAWSWPPHGEAATVDTLVSELIAKFPGLEAWRPRMLVAVDLEYATGAQAVDRGQEVALMPPVQGG